MAPNLKPGPRLPGSGNFRIRIDDTDIEAPMSPIPA